MIPATRTAGAEAQRAPAPSTPAPMTSPTNRTRREPTQERGRRTFQRILDATEQIIAEDGIDAANTRAIAYRADVAIPSLYRFFADRDEILDALVQHMVSELDQQSEAAEAAWKPGEQDLIGIELDLHANYFKDRPVALALWFGGRASPQVLQSVHDRSHQLATRVRTRLINLRVIDENTPPAVFELLVELGDRILELAFRDSPQPDPDVLELGRQALTAFLTRWTPA